MTTVNILMHIQIKMNEFEKEYVYIHIYITDHFAYTWNEPNIVNQLYFIIKKQQMDEEVNMLIVLAIAMFSLYI